MPFCFHIIPANAQSQNRTALTASFYLLGLETASRRVVILRANRYAGDHADCLIAYAWQPGSNARGLVEYAYSKKNIIIITNLKYIHVFAKLY